MLNGVFSMCLPESMQDFYQFNIYKIYNEIGLSEKARIYAETSAFLFWGYFELYKEFMPE